MDPVAGTGGSAALPVQPLESGAESIAADDRVAAIDCIALAIAHEAGNEPLLGREAVAQVILNRVRHRAFPKTICGVVYQGSTRRTGCQFTFTCDGSLRRAVPRRTWADALRVAAAALDGRLAASVGSATHYHADYVAPRWAPAMVRVGQIGAHIFYHFPGRSGGIADAIALGATDRAADRATDRVRSRRQQAAPVFSVWGLSTPLAVPPPN